MASQGQKGENMNGQRLRLGKFAARVDARLREWTEQGLPRRLWNKDFTVWSPGLVPELVDRLGWLDLPNAATPAPAELAAFADDVRRDGITTVVLLGMGGSSLAPEVFQRVLGPAQGWPALHVLDTTHPAAVAAAERAFDLARTLFVVSSKSGTTSETISLFRFFWSRLQEAAPVPGRSFVAITDPGTPLETLARERRFRRLFSGPPDVGGRYSALSAFGLVPAALIGIDAGALLARARTMAAACGPQVAAGANPALQLGAALGELALAGRDKLTFLVPPAFEAFPAWVEQLVAESTGKHGRGIVPVTGEPWRPVDQYHDDRVFVVMVDAGVPAPHSDARLGALERAGHPVIEIGLEDRLSLGGEFFRWEMATAVAGAALGIQPFDQPDVQLAKDLARQAMQRQERGSAGPAAVDVERRAADPGLAGAVRAWLSGARRHEYLAVQAYLDPAALTDRALLQLRESLAAKTGLAATVGYGPRFLHSTGQLHKGGPNTGLFLQLVDEPAIDRAVPETSYSFGQLVRAQALGDLHALVQRDRRTLRVNLGSDAEAGIRAVVDALLG